MEKSCKYILIIICIIFTLPASGVVSKKYDYPETLQERKLDEMGSLAGGEGLVFRPGKIKNESTKTQASSVNKYLWQASIEILNYIPLASVDSNGGIIITEWHSPKDKANYRFKINVFIKANIISPDSIQINIFEQTLRNGNWLDNAATPDLALTIEDKILRRARELYISSEVKE